MYVVRRCAWNFTFVDAQNFHQTICVCLGMWTMHYNNESTHMLNLLLIWRTWIAFTLLAKVCLMGTRIKHCSLMMNLARPFKIQNGMDLPWTISRMWGIQKQSAMVKPCISVMANIERFSLCKNNLRLFHSHHVIFEVAIQVSIFVLILVQAVWRKSNQGSSNITTSFRWHPK